MSKAKATGQPLCTEDECQRLKRLKVAAALELRRMLNTEAVVIAVHDAANHEAHFVVADALAVILSLLKGHISALDRAVTAALSEPGLVFNVRDRL